MHPVVVGAGVAGLAAAVDLADAGMRPTLLEARPFVGGRARSFVHETSGDEIDNGQHLMMGCYHRTFDLLERIGTRGLVALQPRLHVEFRDADGVADRLVASSLLPSPLDVLAGMLRLRGLSRRERFGLLRVARAALGSHGCDETVDELLCRLRQSPRARERVWDPIVLATLNTAPAEASSALFLTIMRRAFLGRSVDSRLAMPRVGLSRLFEPACAHIAERGGAVMLGASVTRIERDGERFVIRIKDREPVVTDRVIAALPPRAAAGLLGELLSGARAIAEPPELSPIVSIYLWFDRPLATIPELTALIGTSVQWVFNRRRMTRDERADASGLLSCTISAADAEAAASSEAMSALAERELRRAFARELDGARLVDSLVVKEKHATFRARPDIASRRPGARTSVSGLYLAGDWTATGLPATIEGAVQSGFDAAAAVRAEKGGGIGRGR